MTVNFEYIPTWLVAASALLTTAILLFHDVNKPIPIKIFAISSGIQLVVYVIFMLYFIPPEMKQAISRVSTITMNVTLSIIIFSARVRDGT